MSKQESTFIRWFGAIASALIVSMAVGMFSFYTHTNQKKAADDVRFEYIQRDIQDIKIDIGSINLKFEQL